MKHCQFSEKCVREAKYLRTIKGKTLLVCEKHRDEK